MANTADTTEKDRFITVGYTDSGADWDYATDTPAYAKTGYLCSSITFYGHKNEDEIYIREGGLDGPSIFHVRVASAADNRVRYFDPPQWIRPFIDLTDCKYDDPENIEVVFELV